MSRGACSVRRRGDPLPRPDRHADAVVGRYWARSPAARATRRRRSRRAGPRSRPRRRRRSTSSRRRSTATPATGRRPRRRSVDARAHRRHRGARPRQHRHGGGDPHLRRRRAVRRRGRPRASAPLIGGHVHAGLVGRVGPDRHRPRHHDRRRRPVRGLRHRRGRGRRRARRPDRATTSTCTPPSSPTARCGLSSAERRVRSGSHSSAIWPNSVTTSSAGLPGRGRGRAR